jgi:uncharacterized membrane protein
VSGVGTAVSRHRRPNLPWVAGLTLLAAIGYSVYSLLEQYKALTGGFDLVIFDQAVRSYAHFHPGISPLKGLHNFGKADFSVLGDHWSPIIAVLAPLYWIYNGPEDLLIAQAVLIALAIPPVWSFTRRAFGGTRNATIAAYLVALTYGLSWPVQGTIGFDFHEVAFAPVLTAFGLERLQAGKRKTGLISLACLFLVKEDMGLFVAGIGVALLVMRQTWFERQRLTALLMIPVGVIVSFVEIYVLIPMMGGDSGYYWAYQELGPNMKQSAVHLITHPWVGLDAMLHPHAKVVLVMYLLLPFLLLPLLSPLSIAAVPLLLERLLNVKFPGWYALIFQYNAYLIIILIFAAVDGAARLDRLLPGLLARWRTNWLPLAAAVLMTVATFYLIPQFDFGHLLHRSWYSRTTTEQDAVDAADHVPSNVTVEAPGTDVAAQLTSRDTVWLWDGDGDTPLYAPWVVTSTAFKEFGWPSIAAQAASVKLLKEHGYVTVYQAGDYLVMHAPGVKG